MFKPALLLLALCLLVLPSSAFPAGKGKGCFTAAELTAEREVRHGIFLREASRLCQGRFLADSAKTWDSFEQTNGARFRAAVARRAKAWKREFPKDWQVKQTHADGAIVTYARNYSVESAFCTKIEARLKEITKRGYAAFTNQTRMIRNEVADDYKTCP